MVNGVFFYTATIGFCLGIFLRSFADIGLSEIVFVMLLALALSLLARRGFDTESASQVGVLSIFLFLLALGILRLEWASWSETNPTFEAQLDSKTTIEGVVVREPEVRERATHLYVKVQDELFLVLADRYITYHYGDLVRVIGVLEKPQAFETDLGRTFNYPGYLKARGVFYTVPFAEVTMLGSGHGYQLMVMLLEGKENFLQQLELLIAEPQVGLAEGLLLGVKRALGEELEGVFRETGIIHIVVLSGYNIMIVVSFVMYFLTRLLSRRGQVFFGLIAICLFALMVGLSATVLRASLMAGLLLVVGLTGRVYFALRGLLLAGGIMLILNPYLLVFDTGFQLSFLATLGLILVTPLLLSKLQFVPTFIGVREFLVATLATQIVVLPLLLYHIGQFSAVAVLVNVLVLPMVPVAMLLTFLTGLFSFLSPTLALPLAYLTHLSLSYILLIVTWFAGLPFASLIVPAFPFWLVLLAYGVIGYLIYWLRPKLLGENVLKNDSQSEVSLADWTIVEEEVKEEKDSQK